MLAILSNTIENAGKLSDSLQDYWNARGVLWLPTTVTPQSTAKPPLPAIAWAWI